jgi:hypothetical protein
LTVVPSAIESAYASPHHGGGAVHVAPSLASEIDHFRPT